MQRAVELFEVELGMRFYLFANEEQAGAFAGLACRSVEAATACDPLRPLARVELRGVEARVRRVVVPAGETVCLRNFGRALKPASGRGLPDAAVAPR